MRLNSIVFRSVFFSLILSLGIMPALTGLAIAEEREIPESLKHLFTCNETVSLNDIVRVGTSSDMSNEILISGKVNFEDGKAVNLFLSLEKIIIRNGAKEHLGNFNPITAISTGH